jgi:branched-chain amino acid transport system ATP-binding protein
MGLWRACAGQVRFDGQAIGGPGAQQGTPFIARLGIGYVPENMGIFSDLTVRDNMLLASRKARQVQHMDTQRLEWLFGLFPALKKFWLHPAGKLSGGQKQMLAIARALLEEQRMLLIDEPSKGLAPAIVQNLITALQDVKRLRTTMLLVEQNFNVACALGDEVAVMDNGRIVHRGGMAALAADEPLQRRLLGLALGAHQ